MPIKYDVYPCTGLSKESQKYYVKEFKNRTIDLSKMQVNATEISTVSPTDVVAVISALSEQMASHLLEGYNVHLNSIGYFSVVPDGTIVKTKSGKLVLKNAKIGKIAFRPDKEFLEKMLSPKFERVDAVYNHSNNVSNQEIQKTIDDILKDKLYVSIKNFAEKLNLNIKTAAIKLENEVKAGRLIDKGESRQHEYVRATK